MRNERHAERDKEAKNNNDVVDDNNNNSDNKDVMNDVETMAALKELRLKFERFPHYSSGNDKLNKVHLNLGFTKLVNFFGIVVFHCGGYKINCGFR